jgi:hypothetical protein
MSNVPPDFWKFYWLVWLVIGFGVAEFVALKTIGTRGTFSYFVWWIMGSYAEEREWYRNVARGLLIIFFLWIIPHFFTRWNP